MKCDRVAENVNVDGASQGQGKKEEEMVALYQDDVDNGWRTSLVCFWMELVI